MAESEVTVKKSDFLVDVVLCGGFFAFLFTILRAHVPSSDPNMINLWSAGTAACMTGVFWLSSWMFRTVFRYHKVLKNRD